MTDARRGGAIAGCMGVLCLGLYWAVRFFPGFADTLPDSSFGKFVIVGVFIAGVPLSLIAAMRGSRWWWAAIVAGAITLGDLYVHLARPLY